MIFLTNDHIQQVLDMPTCLKAMEEAYHDLNERGPLIGRASIFMCPRSLITIAGARWKARRESSASSRFV